VFYGPRVAMAIHEDSAFRAAQVKRGGVLAPQAQLCLQGPGVEFTEALVRAVHGGQVVLSQAAWESVKPTVIQHPGAVQVRGGGTRGPGTCVCPPSDQRAEPLNPCAFTLPPPPPRLGARRSSASARTCSAKSTPARRRC
jgi:hypothetical protein